jgi:TPR repeat protein
MSGGRTRPAGNLAQRKHAKTPSQQSEDGGSKMADGALRTPHWAGRRLGLARRKKSAHKRGMRMLNPAYSKTGWKPDSGACTQAKDTSGLSCDRASKRRRIMKLPTILAYGTLILLVTAASPQSKENLAPDAPLEKIRAAAQNGDPEAQLNLGVCYAQGEGVPKDYAEAVKWFRKAAEQNLAEAQFNLGVCYHKGEGVPKDAAEAVKWYRKAAEQNLAEAQFLLGACYANGAGVPRDSAEAVKWYRKAAEQNHAEAQIVLGVCYDKGEGVPKDAAEALKWFRKAAEQNHAEAQFYLGVCYYNGEGVRKDYAEAVKWLRKAAEQNHAKAQFVLGVCYDKGEGVPKDAAEAVKWYRKAAEQNHGEAQFNLGVCYYNGEGVPKDAAEAVKWFRKAAEQNFTTAQFYLGVCYAKGDGVPKDEVEAYKWCLLAGAQGDEDAKKLVSLLEKRLSRDEIREGQVRAREFKPRTVLDGEARLQPRGVSEFNAISPPRSPEESPPAGTGTGFFITQDGYLITAAHVVRDANRVRVLTKTGRVAARVVSVDAANDLALLKAEGRFSPLPIASSRSVKRGATVATVGFPNIGLQGYAPKLAKGEIAALTGPKDDPRYFQISVSVQPGNSGGALFDERGNVVGVVTGKLNPLAAVVSSGALPENVNYAVKSSFLLSFLEAVPELVAKLPEPSKTGLKFEDAIARAEEATALVLVD